MNAVGFWLCVTLALAIPATAYPLYSRPVTELSGDWDFVFKSNTTFNISTQLSVTDIKFDSATQAVPGAWDSRWGTGLQYARGTGIYRRSLSIPAGRPALLKFSACSMFCRVYIDGTLLANHTAGGFTPFEVPVAADAGRDTRELIVVSNNEFSDDLTPTQHKNYDFYQYGGLIRTVSLHVLPPPPTTTSDGGSYSYIKRVQVLPLAGGTGMPNGRVNVTVTLAGPASVGGAGGKATLQLAWDGAAPALQESYAVQADGTVRLTGVTVPHARVWQPQASPAPALHTLTTTLLAKSTPDSVTVRFGLRTIGRRGRAITINGKAVKLRGFNRHDMYPQLGPSLPMSQYDADLRILQSKLNGNFIRGAHYPQDERFLDLCDERGVLVWNEALAWGNWAAQLTDARFMAAELATAQAMVDTSANHPSVILWGFFNEGESDNNASLPSYKAMANAFRSRDPSRLVTWADNRKSGSKALQYADVVSFNAYPGWYGGNSSTAAAAWLWDAAWVKEHWPSKPFIISETGGGGVYGNHSSAQPGARWSEEYQALLDGIDAGAAMNSSDIAGLALWQFTDIKVDQANSSTGRPGGINNKGVLSRWRQPKLAAAAVAHAYSSFVPPSMN